MNGEWTIEHEPERFFSYTVKTPSGWPVAVCLTLAGAKRRMDQLMAEQQEAQVYKPRPPAKVVYRKRG